MKSNNRLPFVLCSNPILLKSSPDFWYLWLDAMENGWQGGPPTKTPSNPFFVPITEDNNEFILSLLATSPSC